MVDFAQVPAGRIDPHVKLPTAIANASAAVEQFYKSQGKPPPAPAPAVQPPPVAPRAPRVSPAGSRRAPCGSARTAASG